MVDKTLTEELMKEKRLEVLKHLVNNQDSNFSINEISENVDASYKTVQTFIDILEDFGFIRSEKHGRTRIVSVNKGSPFLKVFERLGKVDSQPFREVAQKFSEEIKEKYGRDIDSIILFGSVAKGIPVSGSDIDLMILVGEEESKKEIEKEAWSLRDKYLDEQGIAINIIVQTTEEFKRNLRNQQPLETRITEEGKSLEGGLPNGE